MHPSPQERRQAAAWGARRAATLDATSFAAAGTVAAGTSGSKRQRDPGSMSDQAETFEEASAALSSFDSCGLSLDATSRQQLKQLFALLDRDGKRVVTAADLDGCWAQVGPVLDADTDGGIDQREFVTGIKKLALQRPFSGSRALPPGITHDDVGALLAASLNASVQEVVRELHALVSAARFVEGDTIGERV